MFQQQVRRFNGYGVPGEIVFDGPNRVQTGITGSTSALSNIIGRVFTQARAGGVMSADGNLAEFGGILCNPKVYAGRGTVVGGTLAPTLQLPNNTVAEFLQMGFILLQTEAAQAAAPLIGDILLYATATGAIVTVAAGTEPGAGQAAVPNATVWHLPGAAAGAASLYVARLTN